MSLGVEGVNFAGYKKKGGVIPEKKPIPFHNENIFKPLQIGDEVIIMKQQTFGGSKVRAYYMGEDKYLIIKSSNNPFSHKEPETYIVTRKEALEQGYVIMGRKNPPKFDPRIYAC